MVNTILNIVGWLGTLLVMGALGIRFLLPSQEQYAFYLAWGGLVCILLYMLSQWREVVKVFKGRSARYGTMTGVSVLVVLGILVAINYLGKRQNKRWDFTETRQFTLSDQSANILSKLDAPLKMTAFVEEPRFAEFRDRLKEYEYGSKQVATEYVDPDKKPAVAQQNQVTQYGTIVLDYKGRTERITTNTEQDITNGIIKVVTGAKKKVYFTQGHGERDTASTDPRDGYSTITAALGGDNYGAEKLVLIQQATIPDDATVVVVAGPKNDFVPAEIELLKTYLGKQGKLLLLLDPPVGADAPPLTNLVALAHDWGVDVGNDVVVDVSGMGRLLGTGPEVPVAASYPNHPIVDRFSVFTAYPMARSVTAVPGGVNGHTAQPFVESSPRSWAETDIKSLLSSGKVELDEGKDKQGPVALAAAVSFMSPPDPSKPEEPNAPKPETRVVVFGDSDFAANSSLGIQGNKDLFLNSVGWLSQQENLISIRAKEPTDRRLTITATQQANINWFTMLGIPILIFGTGIYSWRKRRA